MTYPYPWSHLKFWGSGEWQVVREKLDDCKNSGILVNPTRSNMFTALRLVPADQVRIAVISQDPYPEASYATGVAFSVPDGSPIPPSLVNIFTEYSSDLHYPTPTSGDLSPWCSRGVLLWNAFPTCANGKPGSHHWPEWEWLTKEIVEDLDKEHACVFIFLGKKAQAFAKYAPNSDTIITSHPSPLGVNFGFKGSRIFTTANAKLCEHGLEPINWRLP